MKPRRDRCFLALTLSVFVTIAACKKSEDSQPPKPVANVSTSKEQTNQGMTRDAQLRFVPIDSSSNFEDWKRIIAAFNAELQPDPPAKDPAEGSYKFKQIARAWRYGDAALVVLEKRAEEKSEWDRLFELYNFDLAKKTKTPITAKWPFWLLKFDKLANFEKKRTPDITFESSSCTECEPAIILSSVCFDEHASQWKLRMWPGDQEGVEVFDTGVNVDGSDPDYAELFGIADFQSTGSDQVAVWAHYRLVDDKNPDKVLPVVTTLDVFGFKDGAPTKTEIKDKMEIDHIKKRLCEMNPNEAACKKSK